jgi:hypothetical protein
MTRENFQTSLNYCEGHIESARKWAQIANMCSTPGDIHIVYEEIEPHLIELEKYIKNLRIREALCRL